MEKLNIAELLKGCPKGMELDCIMYDNVVFEKLDVSSSHHPIILRRGTDSIDKYSRTVHLTKYGQYSDDEDCKCLIFPKGKTTWEGFVPPCKFQVGDKIKHKDSGIYCTLGEYSEGISAYRTDIGGLSITYKDMEQWELAPNKFDATTLVPFESRVLVRNGDNDIWKPAIFGCYIYKSAPYYVLGGTCWKYCIPYEGNKHLLRTTNDCDDYYKIW